MGDSLEYPDVLQEIRGTMNPGRLKLQSNLVIFKNIKTGIVEQFSSSDIIKLTWLIRARGYCLKILLENGTVHRYDGFKESEYEKLSNFFKNNYEKPLKRKDVALKGWNWGIVNFVGNSLEFEVEKHPAFDVPLNNVSHTVTAKNEVTLEFHPSDDAAVSLMEMRFHIPTDANPEVDVVNEFHQNVLAKADIIQATGDAIANFSEVQCLTPRGRYDIKIYQTFMQLHGKTFDYKIPYTGILRLFLLPHKDNRQMFFVVSLDPPMKQGMTRYHFLIVLFNKEYETTLELALSDREIEEKYEGKLTKSMSGPEYEIISRVMKTLVNRKITVPGTFIGHSGTHTVSCSYKAATGFLYPLERGFMFVPKPPIHIRFDEVAHVNFARSSGSTRSFDFEVDTKTGNSFAFVGVEKDEYGKLYDFVKNKKLRVKNIGDKLNKKAISYDDMMGSDDEGQHDAYLQRVKAEGQAAAEDDDEDDDSSEDEDFDPGVVLSEPEDEYDSNLETTDSDADNEGGSGTEGKPKKTKEKKPKSARTPSDKPRRRKKERDETKPKRPLSGYFFWLNANRENIKTENPGISITDLSKKAGEKWRELTDKTEWDAKAVVAKAEYEEAMEVWKEEQKNNPTPDADSVPKSPKKKSAKKRPASASSPIKEGTGGSGSFYKSKEFIEESVSESDDSDKPLKKKKVEKKEKKEKEKKEKKVEKEEKRPKRGQGGTKAEAEDEDADEHAGLPSDESEAEMTDGSVAASASGSGSGEEEEAEEASGGGSDAASD